MTNQRQAMWKKTCVPSGRRPVKKETAKSCAYSGNGELMLMQS
jgi:hypothetical protein